MKVGILGSGEVGKTLAKGFAKHGYDIMIGSRKQAIDGFKVGSFADVAKFGDIVVLAVKGTVAKEVLDLAGHNLKGKIVIDVTNPIADEKPVNGVIKFFTSLDDSLMERLQKAHPEARLVKAFNSIGNAFMVNPSFSERPSMFICGNDASAKKAVAEIVSKFGFEPEDMGHAEAARAIEPLCMLWCIPGLLHNDWNHAFRLIKK